MEFTAELIAGYLGGEIAGDPKAVVTKLAKIEEGEAGALAFLANPKYEHYIYDTKATIVIVNRSFEPTAPVAATMIRVDDAYSCFAKLLERSEQAPEKGRQPARGDRCVGHAGRRSLRGRVRGDRRERPPREKLPDISSCLRGRQRPSGQ